MLFHRKARHHAPAGSVQAAGHVAGEGRHHVPGQRDRLAEGVQLPLLWQRVLAVEDNQTGVGDRVLRDPIAEI